MFTIDTSPARKTAVSALTALAAIGASGMVAEGAIVELEPTAGAFGTNSSYIGTGFPGNWKNWLTWTGISYHAQGPAFATWAIDFGAGTINNAKYRIDANGTSSGYGIPAGSTLHFALVTEPWSAATPDTNNLGPDYGSTANVDYVQRTAIGGDEDVDITPIIQTWQANPSAYFGVRFFITGTLQRGGVTAPNDPDYSGTTANIIVDQVVVPEPTSLGVLVVGSMLALRRRHK